MKFRVITLIIAINYSVAFAQNIEKSKSHNNDSLSYSNYDATKDLIKDIDNLISSPELFNANIGVSIYSITRNQYLYNYNQNKNFTPASLMKLFSSYAGLHYLGGNFSTYTEFYTNGIITKKGVLLGDLIVFSNGNLNIKNSNYELIFSDLVASLDSVGIQSIKGNLVIDNSYFDNVYYPAGWAIDDIKYEYSAQISAVNFNENLMEVELYSDTIIDGNARLAFYPNTDYFTIENEVQIISNGNSNIYYDRLMSSNIIELWGDLKKNDYAKRPYRLEISVDNPSLYFANILHKYLNENNISFNGNIIEHTDDDNDLDYTPFNLMSRASGDNVLSIVRDINTNSNNLSAEILLKILGTEKAGVGSTEKGIQQVLKLAEDIGIPSTGLKMFDGSGLSRLNLVSPISVIRLLNYIASQRDFNSFRNSFSRPKLNGTFKNRLKGTSAEDRVWVKTGSMNYVNNVAGYLVSSDGELFCFAIFFNNFTAPSSTIRNIQDLILMRLSSLQRKSK